MSSVNVPPGPSGLAGYLTLFRVIRDQEGFHRKLSSKYGDISSYAVMDSRTCLLTNPEHVRDVLVVNDDEFGKPHVFGDDPVFQEGIVAVEGEKWQRQRDTVGQTIRKDRILDRTESIVACIDDEVESWSEASPVSLTNTVSDITLQVLSRIFFGGSEGVDIDQIEQSLVGLQSELPVWSRFLNTFFPSLPNPKLDQWAENQQMYVERLEEEVFAAIERGEPDSGATDLLSLLLVAEQEGHIDREEIRDQLVTMLFTGYGNPVTILTYSLVRLTNSPKLQSELRAEIDRVAGDEAFDQETLDSLELTDRYLREVLRLYPPAPYIQRITTSDVERDQYVVPEGTRVKVPVWLIQRDDRFWERPNEFDPTRWEGQDAQAGYRFAPFGAGLRKCPARDFFFVMAKITLAVVLQRFRIEKEGSVELTPGANLPNEPDHSVHVTSLE